MSQMTNPNSNFTPLKDICPELHNWNIKVQVIRIWAVGNGSRANDLSSVEMVLIDSEHTKMQASMSRELMHILRFDMSEGFVYLMSGLRVISNDGLYKATKHPYKLQFQKRTRITYCEGALISDAGLSPMNAGEILEYKNKNEYGLQFLVDMVAVVTAISSEREHRIEGRIQKIILMELTDFSGKVECALFDENAEEIRHFFRCHGKCTPIIGVQFAQVMPYGCVLYGDSLIQDVTRVTKILINPHTPESNQLMKCVSMFGLDFFGRAHGATRVPGIPLQEEFLILHDRRRIGQLHFEEKGEFYVVYGKIVRVLEDRPWWYLACFCRHAVTPGTHAYFCSKCDRPIMHATHRYKIIVEVSDDENKAYFALSDPDAEHLLRKSCKDMIVSIQNPFSPNYPIVFQRMFKKELLFLVEKGTENVDGVDSYFEVKRICHDADIIKSFVVGDYQLIDDKEKFCNFLATIAGQFKSDMGAGCSRTYSSGVQISGSRSNELGDDCANEELVLKPIIKSLNEEFDAVSSPDNSDNLNED